MENLKNLKIKQEKIDPKYFSEKYLVNEKLEQLDFENRTYLNEIYDTWCDKEIVLKKSAQVGASAYCVNNLLWMTTQWNLTAIYALPTAGDVSEFKQARFNKILNASKYPVKYDVDNMGVNSVGGSTIYFRGTWSERQAISVPADIIFVDEIDRCKQDILQMFYERLSASKLGWKRFVSTPTFPDFGIDALWQLSDKREWFVLCTSCKEEQILSDNHIDKDADVYRCAKCGAPLDNRNGRWRATASSEIVGFHPTQLIAPWIRPKDIIAKRARYEFTRDYYNMVLGEVYAGGDELITRADVLSCIVPTENAESEVSVGVDWGNTSWFVVRKKEAILHYGKIEGDTRTHARQVIGIAEKFDAAGVYADHGYGDTKNIEITESRLGDRFYSVIYTGKGHDLYPRIDDNKKICYIDRTTSLQRVMEEIKQKKIKILPNEMQEEFVKHFGNLITQKVTDKHGMVEIDIARKGDDHLAHANNYSNLHFVKQKDNEFFFEL